MKKWLFLILVLSGVCEGFADTPWFSAFYQKQGATRVYARPAEEIDSIAYSLSMTESAPADSSARFVTHVNVCPKEDEPFTLDLDSLISMGFRQNIPTIYIDTDRPVAEIPDKVNYLTASFSYVPYDGLTDSLQTTVSIKGRGNTSWDFPQKPYRLKFDKKVQLAGFEKAKSFVLVSNYLDNTLMRNAVAFKIAELIGMPFSNKACPVDLVLNGTSRGNYILTQKIGINSGSADFDETKGILWELDVYYDEDYRFRSSRYRLPCMVKDPDFVEIADGDPILASTLWNYWKADLDLAIAKVYDGNWQEAFDARQIVLFALVNDITANFEINYPKSVYLYKAQAGDKYSFGPVWDFDWALGFDPNKPVNRKLTWETEEVSAYPLFRRIFETPEFMEIFREEFQRFCDDSLPELLNYIDEYAENVRISAARHYEVWPEDFLYEFQTDPRHTGRFLENVEFLKKFLLDRVEAIRQSPTFLLY